MIEWNLNSSVSENDILNLPRAILANCESDTVLKEKAKFKKSVG